MSADKASRYEFSTSEVVDLLDELDHRLRLRGVATAVFVVGGAAIAAAGVRGGRLTEDVDAITQDRTVLDEAAALAAERGLPGSWLNSAARMWMPPLPPGVMDHPEHPGLRITFADDGFLLATKLVAQRAKDADDIEALAERLGMLDADAAQLEAHMRNYYTDHAALEFIVDGSDVDRELAYLAADAAAFLRRRRSGSP